MASITQQPPVRAAFAALLKQWGPQHWWPGHTRFEVIVGAILTQNTAWTNVERAIANLRAARALSPATLHALSPAALAELIRPAGTYRVKVRRLRAFTEMLANDFGGSLDQLFRMPTAALRARLLSVHGIGPETADCILLYAAHRPVFVVDAYTKRLAVRHGWAPTGIPYDALAQLFAAGLPNDESLFNEFHALIVAVGKRHCRAVPRCAGCPLAHLLPPGGPHPLGERT